MFNWLSIFAGICYVILGVFVIIEKSFIVTDLQPNVAYGLGALICGYGIFRVARAVHNLKKQKNEN